MIRGFFSKLNFELDLFPPVVVELIDSTASLRIYSPVYVGEVVLSGKEPIRKDVY